MDMIDPDGPTATKLAPFTVENNWCYQCYTEEPILNRLGDDYHGQQNIPTVNVTAAKLLAEKY